VNLLLAALLTIVTLAIFFLLMAWTNRAWNHPGQTDIRRADLVYKNVKVIK
jgi:hypothetical protein